MRQHGLRDCVTKRRQPSCPCQNRTRIVVEHTFSWLDKYRRIILRYDGLVCHFRSFHYLAALQLVALRCSWRILEMDETVGVPADMQAQDTTPWESLRNAISDAPDKPQMEVKDVAEFKDAHGDFFEVFST